MTTKINWNEENTARLVELAGEGEVSQELVAQIADELGTSTRSVGSKLRNMNYEVAKASAKVSPWTPAREEALASLIEANAGEMTYADLAATFEGGEFTAKQIQGKVLSMELFDKVRKAEKPTAQRTYTEAEEAQFVSLVAEGASMEALSEAFGRPVNSIRGKALSLLKSGDIEAMPVQETSAAKEKVDFLSTVENFAELTVEDLAEQSGKTVRGIKSALSRRGITCANYDGAAKRAKLDAKADS